MSYYKRERKEFLDLLVTSHTKDFIHSVPVQHYRHIPPDWYKVPPSFGEGLCARCDTLEYNSSTSRTTVSIDAIGVVCSLAAANERTLDGEIEM